MHTTGPQVDSTQGCLLIETIGAIVIAGWLSFVWRHLVAETASFDDILYSIFILCCFLLCVYIYIWTRGISCPLSATNNLFVSSLTTQGLIFVLNWLFARFVEFSSLLIANSDASVTNAFIFYVQYYCKYTWVNRIELHWIIVNGDVSKQILRADILRCMFVTIPYISNTFKLLIQIKIPVMIVPPDNDNNNWHS